jgi:CDP-diglyceride synthetase
MKLSTEQINYIENYIQSFDIKWYEIQVELTDHLVSIMEEIWEQDPELTFHQVKYQAEQRFGRGYFKSIVAERKTILQKEYNRQQRKMVAEFLKFPKIIASILLGVVAYQVSFYFENPAKYVGGLFGLFTLFMFPMLYIWFRNGKINGKRFLAVEISSSLTLSGFLVGSSMVSFIVSTIKEKPNLMLPFIALWVLLFLFCITGLHIQTTILKTIKKQYQLS